jgi:hypothetical protein
MIPGVETRFPVLYTTDVSGEFPNTDTLRLMMVSEVPRFIAVGKVIPEHRAFCKRSPCGRTI